MPAHVARKVARANSRRRQSDAGSAAAVPPEATVPEDAEAQQGPDCECQEKFVDVVASVPSVAAGECGTGALVDKERELGQQLSRAH